METKELNRWYLFFDEAKNRRIILRRYNTKANFNKYLNKLGVHYYGDDDSIGI
jgi:hypothetical protein